MTINSSVVSYSFAKLGIKQWINNHIWIIWCYYDHPNVWLNNPTLHQLFTIKLWRKNQRDRSSVPPSLRTHIGICFCLQQYFCRSNMAPKT